MWLFGNIPDRGKASAKTLRQISVGVLECSRYRRFTVRRLSWLEQSGPEVETFKNDIRMMRECLCVCVPVSAHLHVHAFMHTCVGECVCIQDHASIFLSLTYSPLSCHASSTWTLTLLAVKWFCLVFFLVEPSHGRCGGRARLGSCISVWFQRLQW